MICPHCATTLTQRERANRTCHYCRKTFALDPKRNSLKLHDVRMKALATRLSGNTYAYTTTQLWYAAARKQNRSDAAKKFGIKEGFWFSLFSLVCGGVCTGAGAARENEVLLFFGGIGLLFALVIGYVTLDDVLRKKVRMAVSLAEFNRDVLEPWRMVYQAYPPHMVWETQVPAPPVPAEPVLAVLSPDGSVLACLAANEVPARFNVALAPRIDQLPAHAPAVAVLHDASAAGYLLAAKARAELAPRPVMDISPRPRSLISARGAVRLRDSAPGAKVMKQLAGTLTPPELEWLAKGWWSPVAALRPSDLIARVFGASERASSADPERRAAAAVGFLTWPGAR